MVLGCIRNLPFFHVKLLQALALLVIGCWGGTEELKAQHAIGLNAGVFNPVNSNGVQYGAGLDYAYKASDKVRIGIGAAYYANSNSSSTRLNGIYTYTLREGVFSLYAGADMGLYFIEGYNFRRVYESINYIGMAPVLGAHYKLAEGVALNLQLKFPLLLTVDKGGKGLFPVEGLTALEWNTGVVFFF
jgi:hypothetical protein